MVAGSNQDRHELTEAIWTAEEASVLDAPEGLDTEYGVILNVVDRIMALPNPDVVLRALGADAVLDWLETADGFGFVVEYLRHVAAQ